MLPSHHDLPCRNHTSVSLRSGFHILLLYRAAPSLAGPPANGCNRLPFVTGEIVLRYLRPIFFAAVGWRSLRSTQEYPPLTSSIGRRRLRTVRRLVSVIISMR